MVKIPELWVTLNTKSKVLQNFINVRNNLAVPYAFGEVRKVTNHNRL